MTWSLRCFPFHTWEQWGDVTHVTYYASSQATRPCAQGIRQERRCQVCGKVQLRTVMTD